MEYKHSGMPVEASQTPPSLGASEAALLVVAGSENRAKTLLLKQYTVAETAGQLGYPDAFSFSKQFKRYTGMSPTQFKRTI